MDCMSYLVVSLDLENPSEADLSPSYLTNNIQFGLKTLFGEVGAGIPFSVLKVSRKDQNAPTTALLSCPDTCLVKLRTGLTLQGSYQGQDCCYTVKEVTKSLLSIRGESAV